MCWGDGEAAFPYLSKKKSDVEISILREELQEYIATADTKKVEALHTLLQKEIEEQQALLALTPAQEAILDERLKAHREGTAEYISMEKHMARLQAVLDEPSHVQA